MNKTFNSYDILEPLKTRTGMYTGENTLKSIRTFYSGYRHAMDEIGVIDEAEPNLNNIHDWIAKKLGFYESTAGFPNMILAVTMGLKPEEVIWEDYDKNVTEEQHLKSIKLFYELLEEYKKERIKD